MFHLGTAFSAHAQVGQDPATGRWYSCPHLYTLIVCPRCTPHPPLRCKTDFGFTYRCGAAAALVLNPGSWLS
jgi:hypothetical protein